MKAKVIEIRWNDKQPIYSTDFHSVVPVQHLKKAHPYAHEQANEVQDEEKAWRLATCGADNKIRLWLVHPRPVSAPPVTAASLLAAVARSSSAGPASSTPLASTLTAPPPPSVTAGKTEPKDLDPKVEYLATLSQHQGVVNCVRFSPNGDALASAGDDGNILIWVPGEGTKSFGETTAAEDLAFEKESWRVKGMIRSLTGKEIYDLAWSPCGTRILAGSVDHTATIYCTQTCTPLYRLAEHTNYVQGVAWDPRGGYIATQSSDRTMHVYEVKEQQAGQVEVHAVGRNSRMEVAVPLPSGGRASTSRSSSVTRPTARTSTAGTTAPKPFESSSRPSMPSRTHSAARSDASSSEASGSTTTAATSTLWPLTAPKPSSTSDRGRARSASGAAGTAEEVTTSMDPPQGIPHHPPAPSPSPQLGPTTGRSHSRRSSASGSATGMSPRATPTSSRPLRSPSPAPLPAVMPAHSHSPSPRSAEVPTFASSGASDAGASTTATARTDSVKLYSDANSTHFFRRLAWSPDGALLLTPAGLWEDPYAAATMQAAVASGSAASRASSSTAATTTATEPKPTVYIYSRSNIARPPIAHLPGHRTTSLGIRFCPVLWQLRDSDVGRSSRGRRRRGSEARATEEEREQEVDEEEEENAVSVQLSTEGVDVPLGSTTASDADKDKGIADVEPESRSTRKPKSLFDLPYRMVYAVATLDSVYLYDTQQAGPLAMFGNLHYAPFTDLTWSPDGETLVISSQDGYCSVIAFEPGELGTPYIDEEGALDFTLPKPVAASVPSPQADSPAAPTAATLARPGEISTSSASDAPQTGDKRDAGSLATATGGTGEPAPKKVKKRVAPTLLTPG